jgi:hypothetical protein
MKKILLIITVSFFLISENAESVTNISQSPVIIPPAGIDTIKAYIQLASDNFGSAMSNAYSLGNISGYPMGSSHIRKFFIGLSINAGLTNTYIFDPTAYRTNWSFPGFGVNPVVFFGLSLGDNMDLIAKVMVFNDAIYKPPLDFSPLVSLTKINLYSAGAKFRYTPVKKTPIFPGLFEFGGITLTAGVDAIYGIIGLQGAYQLPIAGVNIPPVVDATFDSHYSLMLSWWLISPSVQGVLYFDFFWIFSIYTGFGLAVHLGSFDLNLIANGNLNVGATTITALSVSSVTSYAPSIIMPLYILGLDINLYILQISVESMVNMLNLKDINIQVGIRSQW